ncbi:hypothetical protein [Octadecabacter sp. R77987]|uniref:hypothetical protein n=1 Tax=Octadecabacter sp. R77987 TaxID=3093874 RepID=UPI003671E978
MALRIFWMVCVLCLGTAARAEVGSLFPMGARGAVQPATASLFGGAGTGMFAPVQARVVVPPALRTSPTAQLLTLIAQAEAGPAGYDAVQHGARIRPPAPPTQLTLGEIYDWIEATPGQPHAIGRYQFIPSTLRRLADGQGMGPDTPFIAAVQDRLALVLLQDAGLHRFEAGTLDRVDFMHNLARIWAGLPLPDGTSYYEGHAGNRATMTWARFESGMAQIWSIEG